MDLEKRKKDIREYIRNNPHTTFREIKKDLHTKINKVYSRGMAEAFEDAGVPIPRTLKYKTKDEKKQILINYIRENPKVGGHIIRKETKINFLSIFKNTEEMFEAANVAYPRKDFRNLINRKIKTKRKQIIKAIKNNPLIGISEISNQLKVHPYRIFKNIKEIYKLANINYINRGDKRRIKKQRIVIEFIKRNPLATQREINKECNTHVQELFDRGIFEAYEKAGVQFPFERINLHGAAYNSIKKDAMKLEEEIGIKLSGYGKVNRLIKTKRGIADIILERKNKKAVIEVKNYKSHQISFSQIKQVNKYLEDINSNIGFLICLKKPKKDTFLIGSNKIFILLVTEVNKIPNIMDLW